MKKFNFILNTNKTLRIFLLIVILLPFIILVMLLLKNAGQANAQVSSFYPTSCLGGWKNVEKATGEPEVTEDLTVLYNDNNSASITNAISQIFCGGFKGEIPEDALQKSIVLKFSWTEVRPEIVQDVTDDSTSSPALELEEVNDDSSSTPTEEPATEPNESAPSEEESLSPEEITPVPEPEKESVQEEPEILPEVEPAEPKPVQPIPTETEPAAFNFIFKTAHAQETEEPSLDASSLVPEETEPIVEEPSVPNARLEVLYTVNGQDWASLGFLEDIDNSASFDLPAGIFTTVEDLSQVQIAIHILPTYDNLHTIYLDSMWLEAEYEEAQTNTPPPLANVLGSIGQVIEAETEEVAEDEEINDSPSLSVRKFEKNIILDKKAAHSCEIKPFRVDMSSVNMYIMPIALEKDAEGLYELEIGSLPNGVVITFAKNDQYSYQPESSESELDLKIINEAGSQKGDFNIPIIFSKKSTQDSSVICQINIINQ